MIGVPAREQFPHLNEAEWSLLEPRMGIQRGMIFACLDEGSESLEDYLGDFRWYVDMHFALRPDWKSMDRRCVGYCRETGNPARRTSPATATTRGSCTVRSGGGPCELHGADGRVRRHVTECSGHATSAARVAPDQVGFWGNSPDYAEKLREGGCTPAQIDFARSSMTGQGTIFPNASFIHGNGNDAKEHERSPFLGLAVWRPRSATTTEVWRWAFVPSWYTEEQKRRSATVAVAQFGPAGNAEQDDSVVWAGTAAAGSSMFAKLSEAKLNYSMAHPISADRSRCATSRDPAWCSTTGSKTACSARCCVIG